jgi:tetratricopeptide (TPR) repeat protein
VPGPDVTVEAAAALAGTTNRQARWLPDRLAATHLVDRRTPERFAFHDLLRLYAAQCACEEDSEAERRAAIQGLYDWYLHTVDAAARQLYPEKLRLPLPQAEIPPSPAKFEDHIQALAWLDAERPNLVAAVRFAAEHGPRPCAWLFADAMRGYFWLRMHIVDWLAVAYAGFAAAEADGDLAGQAAAQLSLADAHDRQSRYHQAVEHYTQAWTLSRRTGWLEGQSAALGNLGSLYLRSGQLHEATDHLAKAWVIDKQLGWVAGEAVSLSNLGGVYHELGRLQQAADHHLRALALVRQLGSRSGEAIELSNLGETYRDLGRLDDALDHLTHALDLHREIGNRGNEADSLRGLAEVHRDTGRTRHALELARAPLRWPGTPASAGSRTR